MGLFEKIPRHNQLDILKKLDFQDFVSFKKCSQETVKLTENFKHLLPFKCLSICFDKDAINWQPNCFFPIMDFDDCIDEPVRLEANFLQINSPDCHGVSLEDFCKEKRFTAELLRDPIDTLDPLVLNNVIKLVNINRVSFTMYTPSSELLNQPEFRKLKGIELNYVEIGEDDFLVQEATKMTIAFGKLTVSALHKYLKQWLEGKRRIERVSIIPFKSDPEEMLRDLGCTVHYSHRNGLPPPVDNQNVYYICSLTRGDGKKLFVAIDKYRQMSHKRILASEYDIDKEESWIRSKYDEIYAPDNKDNEVLGFDFD